MLSKEAILDGLSQFYGTENYYRHLSGKLYTDGVKWLAVNSGCYWLLDEIFFAGKKEPFQVWHFEVSDKQEGRLTMQEDKDRPFLVDKQIDYTDFPLKSISLWLIDGVLILPTEY